MLLYFIFYLYGIISIDVQGDNTVDKGLISAPFALLSLRVRPVRIDQVPERGAEIITFSTRRLQP